MPSFTIIPDVIPLLHVWSGVGLSEYIRAGGRASLTSSIYGGLIVNRIVLAMVAVIALSGFTIRDSAMTNTPPTFTADDESAVRGLVDEFANTWTRHDMKAMHELDTQDVEWVNVVGHHWIGKANVYKGHTAIHKGMSATSPASVESATVRSIAPNVAIAVATMHFGASTDPHFPG
jgi:uncharacterized protein (TIGR02246 family)